MPKSFNGRGLSKAVLAAIVIVVIIVVAIGAYFAITYHPTKRVVSPPPTVTKPTVTVVSNQTITLAPPNPNELIDISEVYSPDCLDPATGFIIPDTIVFNVLYQELVTWNPSNTYEVEPMLATNWTVINYQHYIFTLRQGVYFTDGEPFNATVVWFSLYRTIIMGQGPGIANYAHILFNYTKYSETGFAIPWGACHALANVTGNPAYISNATLCAYALADVLSNFNVQNATIQKLMTYPDQAVVVLGPYEVEINLLRPYRFFLLDIASWWGAMVAPVYVDEHGGVQPNTPSSSYLCQYGVPGTGPYEIESVTGTVGEFTEIILKANPNYWGNNYPPGSLPVLDQPAHIPIVDIKISESHTDRVELFASNEAQISYVSPPFLDQIYTAWPYNKYLPPTSIILLEGYMPAGNAWLSMNNYKWPFNCTDFRLAIVHAINLTALLYTYYSPLLNKTLAEIYLGPSVPQYAPFYNPDNLPLYSYNVTLALEYLNESGWECNFYTVLPNGTIIGNPNGQKLPTISLTVSPPVTPLTEEQLEIITQDLSQIGIPVAISYVTSAEFDTWVTPDATAAFFYGEWLPDWPDPMYQIMYSMLNVANGGLSGDLAWFNNTIVNELTAEMPFVTNETEQLQMLAEVYNITYWQAPYYWMPFPEYYIITQPYLKGIVWTFDTYYYNTMYYQPITLYIITYSNGTRIVEYSNGTIISTTNT